MNSVKSKFESLAYVREAECIGCTKCIQVCPVSAILGGPKSMHTIIAADCTGCELCVPSCPVDCIEMIALPALHIRMTQEREQVLMNAREKRLALEKLSKNKPKVNDTTLQKKLYIQAAIARAREKKLTR